MSDDINAQLIRLRVSKRAFSNYSETYTPITRGNVNHDAVSIRLDSEWDGLTCKVTFTDNKGVSLTMDYEDKIVIPWEVCLNSSIYVTVYGTLNGIDRLVTQKMRRPLKVAPAGSTLSTEGIEATEDVVYKAQKTLNELTATIPAVEAEWGTIKTTQADEFRTSQNRNASAFLTAQNERTAQFNTDQATRETVFNETQTKYANLFNYAQTERAETYSSDRTNQISEFNTAQKNRDTEFKIDQAYRSNEFNIAQTQRASKFDNDQADREIAFNKAQTERAETYASDRTKQISEFNADQTARGTAFDEAQTQRNRTYISDRNDQIEEFNTAQTERTTQFNENINNWSVLVATAVLDANIATGDTKKATENAKAATANANTAATAATNAANDIASRVKAGEFNGAPFSVTYTPASIADMEAITTAKQGEFACILSNVEDPDNSKLYMYGDGKWNYITDMSGATGLQGPQGVQGVSFVSSSVDGTKVYVTRYDPATKQTTTTEIGDFAKPIEAAVDSYVDSKFVVVDAMPTEPVDGLIYMVRE